MDFDNYNDFLSYITFGEHIKSVPKGIMEHIKIFNVQLHDQRFEISDSSELEQMKISKLEKINSCQDLSSLRRIFKEFTNNGNEIGVLLTSDFEDLWFLDITIISKEPSYDIIKIYIDEKYYITYIPASYSIRKETVI